MSNQGYMKNENGFFGKYTEKTSLGVSDFLVLEDASDANKKKKILGSKFAGSGGGEANTASNYGTAQVGTIEEVK